MLDRTNSVAAAEELLKRRSTRRSFAKWAKHRGFEPAAHHRLIICEIEFFLESDDEVLLLFAPPGSAKSTYVSVLLPSWYLASHPTHSILAATHNVEFAERWGREFVTTSPRIKTSWASRSRRTARRQPGGRSRVGAVLRGWAPEPVSRAFVRT